MHQDLVLIPDDQPGTLARLGHAAGAAGINIEGLSAFTGQGRGIIHVLVADPEAARAAFTASGFDVRAARDVVIVDIEDRPGAIGDICDQLGAAGVNIEQAYIASGPRLVLAVDDLVKARAILNLPD